VFPVSRTYLTNTYAFGQLSQSELDECGSTSILLDIGPDGKKHAVFCVYPTCILTLKEEVNILYRQKKISLVYPATLYAF
jgi:hypothetical protein